MVFQNDILAGSSGASGTSSAVHTIDQSIRFNSADNAYMTRTPSSAGNRRTWTFSCWLKRGNISSTHALFNSGADSSNNSRLQITNANVISYVHADSGSVTDQLVTDMVLRDTSAWYNIQLVADTTHAVKTERLRLYVNGQRITDLATTNYPTKDFDTDINNTEVHNIGRLHNNTQYLDGYLAEIVLIDGQALDPSSFGEYNSSNIWIPKSVSGLTFGTNGFHIKGETASDLGNDSNGSNNFTAHNFNEYDKVIDTPTNNFAVLNPLNLNLTYPAQLSEGNLKMGVISGGFRPATSTIAMNSGKFYAEAISHDTHQNVSFGFRYADLPPNNVLAGANTGQFGMLLTGQIYDENTIIGTASGVSISGTQRVAIDLDAGKGWLGVDSNFFDSSAGTTGNPSTGANPTFTFTAGRDIYFLFVSYTNLGASTANFGQDGTFAGDVTAGGNADANGIGNFKESVPTDYLALCTKNLGS